MHFILIPIKYKQMQQERWFQDRDLPVDVGIQPGSLPPPLGLAPATTTVSDFYKQSTSSLEKHTLVCS